MRQSFEDEEYEEYYGEEGPSHLHAKNKKKYKGKGHQSKHRKVDWDAITCQDDDREETPSFGSSPRRWEKERRAPEGRPIPASHPSPASSPSAPGPSRFVPGPNTHTIKGNVIDFDRLASIDKVERDHNGVRTYGIKFTFAGTRGLYRLAWFNVNSRERDRVYNEEYAFWAKAKAAQGK